MTKIMGKEERRAEAEAKFRRSRRKVLDALQGMRDQADEWPGVDEILDEAGVRIEDETGGQVSVSLSRLIEIMRRGLSNAA